MNSLLGELRETFIDSISTSCEKRGCKLNLDGINKRQILIVDNDARNSSRSSNEKLCDYFLFYQIKDIIVAVVELTSGAIDTRDAEQIKNGAKETDTLSCGHNVRNFIPLLLYGRRSHTANIKVIRKTKILFRGRRLGIILKRCGSYFKDILEEVPPLW